MPPAIGDRRIAAGRLFVVVTVAAWVAYFVTWFIDELDDKRPFVSGYRVQAVIYLVVVTLLTVSALAYLCCRLGYFYRARDHRRVPRAVIDDFFAGTAPTLTVIVPSYREEARVIRATLLSAALQEYPYERVTLLIDDPPAPRKKRDREALEAARAIPGEIQDLLAGPCARYSEALERFESGRGESPPTAEDLVVLAGHFEHAVAWLGVQADRYDVIDHAEQFFVDHVVQGLAADFTLTASALRRAGDDDAIVPVERLRQLYQRLVWTFRCELSSFERKQYASLAHDANKAMNLNSYIGLMGGSYRDLETVAGRVLIPASPGASDLEVPDPDYVLTLDADSILLPEYCVRLIYLLEQPQYADVAVAQTPYSAYTGSGTRLERLAGATTDLQFVVHQGMTHYDATFWVGANAVLRKRALDQVKQSSYDGSWEIRRYIRDRTVIEDTESTIDLGTHGWRLFNYPERLSYSATPPDFGSLCIQRQRWANGGLIILPKLWRLRARRRQVGAPLGFGEEFLRAHYMGSIAWSSLSLLLLLAYPFGDQLVSPLLGLVALPYFVAMASDLKLCGYKRTDVLRIYGFNLVLLPVNLGGVASSLLQGITGAKSRFGRTPKVRDRTIPSLPFLIGPYLLVALAAFTLYEDYRRGRVVNGVYAGINAVLALYAVVAFIGIRHSVADLFRHLTSVLYKPVRTSVAPSPTPAAIVAGPPSVDWASVLHYGGTDVRQLLRGTGPVPAPEAAGMLEAGGGGRTSASESIGALAVAARPVAARPVAARPLAAGPLAARPGGGPPGGGPARLLLMGRDAPAVGDALGARPRVDRAPNDLSFRTVFQPIVRLDDRVVAGYEALARFDDGTPPHLRLAGLASTADRVEVEARLVAAAVGSGTDPAQAATDLGSGTWLSVNASVELAGMNAAFWSRLASAVPLVVELDVADVADLPDPATTVGQLPAEIDLALSGVTAGYRDLSLIRALAPRFVKLDAGWVHEVDRDPARQVLVAALVTVVREVGAELIALGIETDDELEAVQALGASLGQGYLLGRPSQFLC